ncbi:MAG: transcriptional regulator [Pyrinomonadaceae bacterium]
MFSQTHTSFEFDRFRLNVTERQLLASGEHVALSPKAFDTLVVLIRKNGNLVTKDEILKEVWRDTFVEESNLSNNIYVLRKALGEDSSGRGYIETVPRHGYRFVGEVREIARGNSEPVLHRSASVGTVVAEEDVERKIVEGSEISYNAGLYIAALMFTLFVICGLYWMSSSRRESVVSTQDQLSCSSSV